MIINFDTVWESGQIINLTENIQIAPGVKLTVEAGATVNGGGFDIQAFGSLDVAGTRASQVGLNNVSLSFGGNYSVPGRIDVAFADFSGGSLFAASGGARYGSFKISDSSFINMGASYVWYPTSTSSFERNLFVSSGGLSIGSNSIVNVTNNIFIESSGNIDGSAAIVNWASYNSGLEVHFNAFLSSSAAIEAPVGYQNHSKVNGQNNWYGTTSETLVNAKILDNEDDLNRGPVVQAPFLLNPDAVMTQDGRWLLGTSTSETMGLHSTGYQTLIGLEGNDVYIVNHGSNDIIERPGGGFDTVYSSVSYTLPSDVEALFLTGTDDLNATGSGGNNTLGGNAGRNVLTGGAGDDIYGVDGNGDTVVEEAGGGYDEVYSSGNYTMAENVETLFLTGSAVYATGNATNNAIIGNDLDNVIDAGAGDFEFINGAGGNDLLIGGAGHDEIMGGAGNDVFRFTSLSDAGDFFFDFTPGEDKIQLNAAAFGIGTAANQFVTGVSFIEGPDVTSAVPTVLYNKDSGYLLYDADGTGAAGPSVLAILNGTPTLHASDFLFY
jgi:hypothetical protein